MHYIVELFGYGRVDMIVFIMLLTGLIYIDNIIFFLGTVYTCRLHSVTNFLFEKNSKVFLFNDTIQKLHVKD